MPTISHATIVHALQIVLALGLINVWLVRFNKPSQYRAKGSHSMIEEFAAYGLPKWFMYLVGTAKVAIAVLLIAGLWFPVVVYPAALFLAILMIGAISMHMKVRDSLTRTLPALLMLTMAIAVVVL